MLEVGGGLGVLSEYLAPRVSHLHVVEVDRSLEAPLREALEPFANATLHLADAVRLDLAALEPAPDKVVANLPYGVAATVLLKSIAELPGATLWVAMVQREVADRLAAAPGGKSYGATSVLAQLAVRGALPAPGARARSSTPSRTWSRRSWCCGAARPRRPPSSPRSCTPASPTAARRWRARWRSRPARRADIRDAARARARAHRPPGRRARRAARARRTGRAWPSALGPRAARAALPPA